MSKKILMLVGDFVEDYEVMVPFQALQAVGHTVHAVCPGKRAGEFVRTAIHDFEGDQTYTEKRGHNFTLNATFDDVDESGYDALVHSRRPSARVSAPEPARVQIVRDFVDSRNPWHPSATGHRSSPPRRSSTASASVAIRPWRRRSARRCGVRRHRDRRGRDRRLFVTAPAWPAHPKWISKFLSALGTTVEHESLATV